MEVIITSCKMLNINCRSNIRIEEITFGHWLVYDTCMVLSGFICHKFMHHLLYHNHSHVSVTPKNCAFDLWNPWNKFHDYYVAIPWNWIEIVTTSSKKRTFDEELLSKIQKTKLWHWLVCGMCIVLLCNAMQLCPSSDLSRIRVP